MDYMIKGFAIGERSLEEFVEDIEQYSDPVKKFLWDEICCAFDYLDATLMDIKSPIEQALFLAWRQSGHMYPLKHRAKLSNQLETVIFEPQHAVKIEAKTYYLDFLLALLLPNDKSVQIAIECDGHDFHEKTKQQARADKQRERALIKAGYTVVRFTGSEIYADPHKCADEIYDVTINLINQFK
jgi:very-short-patch-repair endonuclease